MKPIDQKVMEAAAEMNRQSELVMDEDDAAESQIRSERMKITEHFLRGIRHLAVQKGVRCLAFDCYLLAIGQGKMIGVYSAVEVSKIYRVTKAAATECIDDFQKMLGVPPLPGQRGEAGRKNMATAQKAKLK